MQKMFSTRLEEATLSELERAARRLRISKRQFLEEAIRARAEEVNREHEGDVWADTLGAWRRAERPETTIRRARAEFRRSFERRDGARRARVHR